MVTMDGHTFWSEAAGLLIDMDGVLYRGKMPLPGAADFIAALQERQLPYLFLTNNASKTPAMYIEHLAAMRITAHEAQIFTSALATASYLRRLAAGQTVFVVGEKGISDALREAGFELLPLEEGDNAQVVVSSFDRQLTYAKLKVASLAIERGALFVQTNPDPSYPMPDGLHPGAGAIGAAIVATTGKQPLTIGKPQPEIFRQALSRLGTPPEQTFMLGDRLETDITGAQSVGLHTIFVETGVSSREAALAMATPPDLIIPDLTALLPSVRD